MPGHGTWGMIMPHLVASEARNQLELEALQTAFSDPRETDRWRSTQTMFGATGPDSGRENQMHQDVLSTKRRYTALYAVVLYAMQHR